MKNWLPPGEIPLKGFKIREIGLQENDFRLFLENRRGEKLSLVLHGMVSFRDRGAHGKALRSARLENLGPLKKLTLSTLGRRAAFQCEGMEAELIRSGEG